MPALAVQRKALEPLLPADHVRILHPEGRRGVATVARREDRWIERAVPLTDLPQYAAGLAGVTDAYVSQQTFFGWRRIAQLAQIGANYIDLDYHKATAYVGGSPEAVAYAVLHRLDAERRPAPTYILGTGRGLLCVWLTNLLPRGALPRWMAVQKALAEALKPFGADARALDAARVFRIAGSVNGHSGEPVRLVWACAEPSALWRWDFDELAHEVLPVDRAELVVLAAARAKRRAERAEAAGHRPAHDRTAATLWETYLTDLQKLRRLRWFGGLPEGQRDTWLFLAVNAMSWLAPPVAMRREAYALAQEVGGWNTRECDQRLATVFSRAQMAYAGKRTLWQGVEVDPRYRFNASTIIDWLSITPTEMRDGNLRALIDADVDREREQQRWHAENRNQQRREREGRVAREVYESEHSISRRKPWETLGISRRTWYRRGCPEP